VVRTRISWLKQDFGQGAASRTAKGLRLPEPVGGHGVAHGLENIEQRRALRPADEPDPLGVAGGGDHDAPLGGGLQGKGGLGSADASVAVDIRTQVRRNRQTAQDFQGQDRVSNADVAVAVDIPHASGRMGLIHCASI
jgi:hypothetical protein